jgi:primosomal protein N' (replication factor Y)
MLRLARWIGDYYAATIEQSVRTVLPCAVRRPGARFREQRNIVVTEAAREPALIEGLRRKTPAQATALEYLLSHGPLSVPELIADAGVGAAAIKGLEKKKLIEISLGNSRRDPLADQIIVPTQPLTLFPEQVAALEMVKSSIDTRKPSVVLLHGVTGSGKTEVYLQAIRYVLEQGKGAIVLVPEISLTPQTVERFRSRFGDAIAVLHSHLSDGERHDEWYRIYEGKARIVVGARSALFAPVEKLGLIVVDEEHEPSYKQSEAPRYNARDVAVMRGQMEGCAVLLGSASPSLESFHNVRRGKYGLAVLSHRVDHRQMPVMRIVDLRIEAEREGHLNVLSRELAEAIRGRLEKGEQTMLFLNRRGFATSVLCPLCGFVAVCDQCSVKLTYHKGVEELRCHMCGRVSKVLERCPACGERTIKFSGIGTQRVEGMVRAFFPKARVQRMDADTTTRKLAYHEILGAFKARKIDILIGTQMIAKGLHFPEVTLVGVIYADLSLQMPDFRSAERTFQLLLQVSGRAGRGDVSGEVIVQTFTPEHPAIQAARRLDYEGFMDQELESRRELVYPPFSHLVCITLEGPVDELVVRTGAQLAQHLKSKISSAVTLAGPIPAPFGRIKGQYRHQLILRSPSTAAMVKPLKETLRELKWPAGVRFVIDVDALSMM